MLLVTVMGKLAKPATPHQVIPLKHCAQMIPGVCLRRTRRAHLQKTAYSQQWLWQHAFTKCTESPKQGKTRAGDSYHGAQNEVTTKEQLEHLQSGLTSSHRLQIIYKL